MTSPPRARPRILISHQGCIPIYREPFFRALARRAPGRYTVFYGDAPAGSDLITAPGPFDFDAVKVENRELRVAGKTFLWQPIVRRFLREFDGAVIGEEVKFLSGVAIIMLGRLTGRPVILWGFGYRRKDRTPGADRAVRRLMFGLGKGAGRALLRLVRGYQVYMPSGAAVLEAGGMPRDRVAVVYNTVDIEKEARLRARAMETPEADIRAKFQVGADMPVLLYFGRMLPAKRVDLLIDYARRRAEAGRPIGMILFGSGVEKERLQEQAAAIPHLTFWSPDDLALAQALRIAAAVVIPGFVGLAITHGFAHGVPMITRESNAHSPEIEYLKPGENGLVLPPEPDAFFAGLDAYLDDPAQQERLRAGAWDMARALSIDRTAEYFDNLVDRVVGRRS